MGKRIFQTIIIVLLHLAANLFIQVSSQVLMWFFYDYAPGDILAGFLGACALLGLDYFICRSLGEKQKLTKGKKILLHGADLVLMLPVCALTVYVLFSDLRDQPIAGYSPDEILSLAGIALLEIALVMERVRLILGRPDDISV